MAAVPTNPSPDGIFRCDYCGGPVAGSGAVPPRFCCYGCRVLGEESAGASGGNRAGQVADAEEGSPWFRIGVGAFLAGQSMLFGLAANIAGPEGVARWVIHAGLAASALGALAVLGPPLVREACSCARQRRLTVEWLFLLGIGGAIGASVLSSVRGTGAVYYEVVAVLLTVYAAGKALTASARSRAILESGRLAARFSVARRVESDGRETVVPTGSLRRGDRVRVGPGGAVPVDGRVVVGRAFVRETALTGEPLAVPRGVGDDVAGGGISEDGELEVEVTGVVGERRLDALLRALEQAQASTGSTQAFVDRLSRGFVPGVALVAGLTWGVWAWRGEMAAGVYHALSVLLVACPCALGLATPLAVWQGLAMLASRGIVLRNAGALERLADVREVVFDKTGTLSEPEPVLGGFELEPGWDRAEVLRWVAAVESRSGHPLARAFALGAEMSGQVGVRGLTVIPGAGVEAEVRDGGGEWRRIRIGRPGWVDGDACASGDGAGIARVAVGGRRVAMAWLDERVKPGWEAVVERFGRLGCGVTVLSGDQGPRLERFTAGGRVGVVGGLTPEGKLAWMQERRRKGAGILFVGDGINDAPALAGADVGLVVGGAADLAKAAAAGVIAGGDPLLVVEAVELAVGVRRRVRSALWFAGFYNLLGMLLAAAGLLHPVAAAVLMVGSSSIVAWRAMRVDGCGAGEAVAPGWLRWGLAGSLAAQVAVGAFLGPLDGLGVTLVGVVAASLAAWVVTARDLGAGARMFLGMMGPGGLLMLAGWWVDAGFGTVMRDGVCLCCQSHHFFEIGQRVPWMHLGMLAGGMPFMGAFAGRYGGVWIRVAALLAVAAGMIWGMNAGADLLLRWGGPGHPRQFLLAWGGMTAGMLAGMGLACGALEALERAGGFRPWRRPGGSGRSEDGRDGSRSSGPPGR